MTKNRKKDFVDYDIRVLRSRHKAIRELKRLHKPSLHGFRVWSSNWILIDYFKHYGFARYLKIIDIGCGWGLAGIYCAKNHKQDKMLIMEIITFPLSLTGQKSISMITAPIATQAKNPGRRLYMKKNTYTANPAKKPSRRDFITNNTITCISSVLR